MDVYYHIKIDCCPLPSPFELLLFLTFFFLECFDILQRMQKLNLTVLFLLDIHIIRTCQLSATCCLARCLARMILVQLLSDIVALTQTNRQFLLNCKFTLGKDISFFLYVLSVVQKLVGLCKVAQIPPGITLGPLVIPTGHSLDCLQKLPLATMIMIYAQI